MSVQINYTQYCLSDNSQEVLAGKGCNVIPDPEPVSWYWRYLDKYKDPLIVILLVALALSVGISAYEYWGGGASASVWFEPVGVLFAILLATTVGFVFEQRAEREFQILNQVRDTQPVKVIRFREGCSRPRVLQIPICDVVVGDIVRLENGDKVPADCILLESNSLKVDESAFTGELYADKCVEPQADEHQAAYPANRLLRGSVVLEGNAICRVTHVGIETEEGKGVALTHEGTEVETPLNRQLAQLGNFISIVSFVIAALIVVGRVVMWFASDSVGESTTVFEYLLVSVMMAVTLIVVAVPEGLPMSITVSLALSIRKMLKVKNLVRKLHACETMGAATVICTDKTGTLTQNRMKVSQYALFNESDFALGLVANSTATLSSSSEGGCQSIGNPTEGAILMWLHDELNMDIDTLREQFRIECQKPFSSDTKFMETIALRADKQKVVRYRFLKGAPEVILGLCQWKESKVSREEVECLLRSYASQAMRTLAFAQQELSSNDDASDTSLQLVGIVGIADPIREDVAQAISICKDQAQVDVIVVTGDNQLTANVIACQIGLIAEGETNKTLVGTTFAAMNDEEVIERLRAGNIKVIARARPEDKARLVTLLQAIGHVVAVTGDGTNDAAALSKAQVGLSMGSGTSRAKDASDITIIDDSFSSINKAILWGRSIYRNIQRFILFQMTINVCACLVVLVGSFVGIDSPLNVTQMLWVNLIMDTFAAMALSSLPADERVMTEAPRKPEAHIIDAQMLRHILTSGLLFTIVMLVLWLLLFSLEPTGIQPLFYYLTNGHLNLGEIFHPDNVLTPHEHSIFFTTFVMMQLWNLGNARYFRTGRSLIQEILDSVRPSHRTSNELSGMFLLVVVLIFMGQVGIVQLAPQYFGVEAMSATSWLQIVALTSLVFVIPELARFLQKK